VLLLPSQLFWNAFCVVLPVVHVTPVTAMDPGWGGGLGGGGLGGGDGLNVVVHGQNNLVSYIALDVCVQDREIVMGGTEIWQLMRPVEDVSKYCGLVPPLTFVYASHG
jgi:hypothetical protein